MNKVIELGETIVRFGTGQVGVYAAVVGDGGVVNAVAFSLHQDPHPIGDPVPDAVGKSTHDIGCFLRFEFASVEAVQVVIDTLTEVRDALRGQQDARSELFFDGSEHYIQHTRQMMEIFDPE